LDWQAHEDQWTKLLEQSGQDPLFLSWEWMTIWWRVFGDKPTNSLCLLAAHRDGELVGIAPLYLSTTRRFGLSVRSLQFIGQSWRDGNVISSEYLDVIAACSQRDQMRAVFVHHLAKAHKWSEFTLSPQCVPCQMERCFLEYLVARPCVRAECGSRKKLSSGSQPRI
jgi:CelD/BcsL family acetyltransferase involved in cellulose biosynthesis